MSDDDWIVPVNKFALYQIISKDNGNIGSDDFILSVIERVFESHDDSISLKYVGKGIINQVRSTARDMFHKIKACSWRGVGRHPVC